MCLDICEGKLAAEVSTVIAGRCGRGKMNSIRGKILCPGSPSARWSYKIIFYVRPIERTKWRSFRRNFGMVD
eukprot:5709628-Pyramimonas_sp.AAC.1